MSRGHSYVVTCVHCRESKRFVAVATAGLVEAIRRSDWNLLHEDAYTSEPPRDAWGLCPECQRKLEPSQ